MSSETPARLIAGQEAFLEAFRRHGAGVVIITARHPSGSPTGFTATSLASLSFEPPRATFNMAQGASSYSAIAESDYCLIHFLTARNVELATRFSGPAENRFDGATILEGPHGLPLIEGVSAALTARIVARHETGSSVTVAVEIESGSLGEPGDSLVYQGRTYRVAAPLVSD